MDVGGSVAVCTRVVLYIGGGVRSALVPCT